MLKLYYRSLYLMFIFSAVLLSISYKSSDPATFNQGGLDNFVVNPLIRYGKHAPVCSKEVHGYARCHAKVIIDSKGNPLVTTAPSGYGPDQFHGAYSLPSTASSNPIPIIAIVDAYDQPYIQSDLDRYSTTFGIPKLPACTGSVAASTIPCFQKIAQNGSTSYPSVNSGWALEISLDVEIAHAICQNCSILLVEAYSTSYADLMAAVDQAVARGAAVISNSYGSSEFSSETGYDIHFNHKGIAFTFSSGDSGYGTSYPAASPYVTAVGGTTLNINSNNSYQSETAWNGSGSGCSIYEPQPSWQQLVNLNTILCSKRIIADVSADADPNTGAAVYDSVPYQFHSGWFTVGGTSLSSPIIAGTYALAGGIGSTMQANSIPYDNFSTYLHDITSGNNGSCGGSYLCTAVSGYDGPTGLGSPNGSGDFTLTPTPTPNPSPTPTPTPPTTSCVGAGSLVISGKVVSSTSGISGVTLTLSGAVGCSSITTTNSLGSYKFRKLANGTYTVTPSKTGCSFSPSTQTVTISGTNKKAKFTGSCH